MLTKSAQYALRAVAVIAESPDHRPVLAREIASRGQIPGKYLSKILRDLVRAGVLRSARGIGGGFRLRRAPEKLKLIDVIRPFEDVLASRQCPFGNLRCSDDHPCSMHEQWKPVKVAFETLLDQTTVAQIIREAE